MGLMSYVYHNLSQIIHGVSALSFNNIESDLANIAILLEIELQAFLRI